jgi:hypothetical protein
MMQPVCDFCMREIGPDEPVREIQCGDRFQHLGLACVNCLDKADRLKDIQKAEGYA